MSALIESGLTITVIGMGVVFMLLTLLVWIIQAMSKFAAAIDAMSPAPAAAPAGNDETIAVITAAIGAWRRRHRR